MQELGNLSIGLASLTEWRRKVARIGVALAALAALVIAAVIVMGAAHAL